MASNTKNSSDTPRSRLLNEAAAEVRKRVREALETLPDTDIGAFYAVLVTGSADFKKVIASELEKARTSQAPPKSALAPKPGESAK